MARTLVGLLIVLFLTDHAFGQPEGPLPQFFGVYVRADGRLFELKPNPNQMATLGIQIGGADLIRSLSSQVFISGDIELVVFGASPPPPGLTELAFTRLDWVASEASRSGFQGGPLTREEKLRPLGVWRTSNEGVLARLAPVAGQDARMIRVVPRRSLPAGAYTVDIAGSLYDIQVGNDPRRSARCVVRVISVGGASYEPCPAWAAPIATESTTNVAPSTVPSAASGETHKGSTFSTMMRFTKDSQANWFLELRPDGHFVWFRETCLGGSRASGTFVVPCLPGRVGVRRSDRLATSTHWRGTYESFGDRIELTIAVSGGTDTGRHVWTINLKGGSFSDFDGALWTMK